MFEIPPNNKFVNNFLKPYRASIGILRYSNEVKCEKLLLVSATAAPFVCRTV